MRLLSGKGLPNGWIGKHWACDQLSSNAKGDFILFLDADTVVSPGSKDASYDAVGSIITGIDGIENGEFDNFFACVRPPGHHATKDTSMGFCVFNSVSCGTLHLLKKYKYKKYIV